MWHYGANPFTSVSVGPAEAVSTDCLIDTFRSKPSTRSRQGKAFVKYGHSERRGFWPLRLAIL